MHAFLELAMACLVQFYHLPLSRVHAFCHSRIIWLGGLNYRIALSYRSVKALVEMRNWKALLEKDQVSEGSAILLLVLGRDTMYFHANVLIVTTTNIT